jgi:hypothetical protein
VPWWRKRYLDLALAVLSLPLLAQARLLAGPDVRRLGAGDDPLSLLLPGLALAFLALAGIRLLPPFAALVERAGRGVGARLAAIQLRRAPGQHARLALLMTVTVALGVFAAAYVTTAGTNASDRAAYAGGADLRAVFGGSAPADLQMLRVEGAAAQSPVFRAYGRPGAATEDVPLLGVDPYSFPGVGWNRPGLTSAPFARLLEPLATAEQGGLLVPEGTTRLSIWVDGAGTGSHLAARLSDSQGRPVHADFGALDYGGWRQLTAALVAEAPPIHWPLRFRELRLDPPRNPGRIGLSDLTAGSSVLSTFDVGESSAHSSQSPLASPGEFWWATDQDSGVNHGELQPGDADVYREGRRVDTVWLYEAGGLPVYVRPAGNLVVQRTGGTGFGRSVREPVPALMPGGVMASLGLKLGDVLSIGVESVQVSTRVVGNTDYFPTVYPNHGQFFVLQEDLLLMQLGEAHHQRPFAGELWVAVSGSPLRAAADLRRVPQVVEVVERSRLEAAAVHAPLQLGLESNLVLGFVAAVLLALLGFGLHFLLVARARLTDYAILEANGMSARQVRTSLAVEQLVLLAFSLAAGAALGALLALGLLPVLDINSFQSDTVPPTVVAADPRLVLGALLVVAGGGALAGPVIAGAAGRPRLMAELRSMG